ncbi:MAG: AAA family ATPase [Acidobacteriota bacterium]|nr:MAG: AAA family ATPase [Acidobacteriota bacterium]
MKIEALNIEAFGQFTDLELSGLSHPVVVFRGPNEAGKSTLFEFLKTMLYGIYPTSKEQHPYVPWSGRTIEGRLQFRTADGQEMTVSRRLLATPDGKLITSQIQSIRNQTVPAASHISRELFDAVYALSLADMAALEDRPWNEIQERLLGTVGLEVFRPVRSVISDLNSEAGSLWRETGRGNQEVRDLEKAISALRKERTAALVRDKSIRNLDRQVHELGERKQTFESEQKRLKERDRQIGEVLPVRNLKKRIQESLKLAGEPSALSKIPNDPAASLGALEEEILEARQKRERLQRRASDFEQLVQACSEADRVLAQLKPDIDERDHTLISSGQRQSELERMTSELAELERGLSQAKRDLLTAEIDLGVETFLIDLSMPELKAAMQRFDEATEEFKDAEQALRNDPSAGVLRFLIPSISTAAVGILLCALGLSSSSFLVPGLALTAIGAVSALLLWPTWRRGKSKLDSLLTAARAELDASRNDVHRLLGPIPLPKARIARPDAYLVGDLGDLQRSLREVGEERDALQQLQVSIDAGVEEYTKWAQQFAAPGSKIDARAFHRKLKDECAAAVERVRTAESAKERATELAEEIAETSDRMELKESLQRELSEQLAALGEGDLAAGLAVVAKRREAFQEARQLTKTLDQDYPHWKAIEEEIRQLETADQLQDVLPGEREELNERLEEISDQMETLSIQQGETQTELKHLQEQPTASDIESEMEALRLEKVDTSRRRDQLALLASVIQYADERFREKHQPDVLKRASHFLSTILENRYTGIGFDDESNVFYVLPSGGSHPITIGEPLSRGTLDQIYLALRLALVEHLDATSEPLPIFLDEVMVNWDQNRRKGGYALLEEVSRNRQILFFTCHDWLKDELVEHLSACQIALG